MLLKKQKPDWHILFNTLLGKEYRPYEIEETDDEIILKGTPEDLKIIKEKLDKTLATPDSFYLNLPYKTNHQFSSSNTITDPIEKPEDTVEDGLNVLRRLFKKSTVRKLEPLFYEGDDDDSSDEEPAYAKDGILYSNPTDNQELSESWRHTLNYLVSHFNHVDIATIRRAWLDDNFYLPSPPKDLGKTEDTHVIAEGLAQQCFNILSTEDPREDRILFNFARLYELVAAPEIQHDIEGELHIPRQHLISYLLQLNDDGVLLRVYNVDDETHARPVFFGRSDTISRPTMHTIVIDRSSSMGDYFSDLKDQVNHYLHALAEQDPDAHVRIVFFDEHVGPIRELPLSSLSACTDFIRHTPLGGYTALFDTIRHELNRLIQGEVTKESNVTLTFFSDGGDNESSKKSITDELNAFDQQALPRPKCFTLGFGQVDSDTMSTLAMAMGNQYIHLEDISDFNRILEHMGEIGTDRKFIDFVYEIEKQSQQYSVPVYLNNAPTAPKLIIPMREGEPVPVTINGNEMIVTVNPDLIPEATVLDQLEEIAIGVRHVLLSQVASSEKLETIAAAERRADAITGDLTASDRSQIAAFKHELESWKAEVPKAEVDDRLQNSFNAYIRGGLGLLSRPQAPQPLQSSTSSYTFK